VCPPGNQPSVDDNISVISISSESSVGMDENMEQNNDQLDSEEEEEEDNGDEEPDDIQILWRALEE